MIKLNRSRLKLYLIIFFALFVAFIGGYQCRRAGYDRSFFQPYVVNASTTFDNYLKGSNVKAPKLKLTLSSKKWQTLVNKREEALEVGFLFSSKKDFVSGELLLDSKSVQVDVRLKGDVVNSLRGDKWPFRVHVKKGEAVLGMSRFSLHHPSEREYLYEWVYHKAMRREGVLGLRYQFVELIVNDENWGVYAMEESFGQELLADQGRPPGPILRFREDAYWDVTMKKGNTVDSFTESFLSAEIDSYQTGKILEDRTSRQQALRAMSMLEGFRQGTYSASEVFDVKKMATLAAFADLMNGFHANLWRNRRFYYNPITSLIEPIVYDNSFAGDPILYLSCVRSGRRRDNESFVRSMIFINKLFDDPLFFKSYIEILQRISKKEYMDNFWKDVSDELSTQEHILYSEFPEFNFNKNVYEKNQKFIRTSLDPYKLLQVWEVAVNEMCIVLHVAATQYFPVEIVGLVLGEDRVVFDSPFNLRAKELLEPVSFETLTLPLTKRLDDEDKVKLLCRVPGAAGVREEKINKWSYMSEKIEPGGLFAASSNLSRFPFLEVDEIKKIIVFKQGEWRLSETLYVPKGYVLKARGGTSLILEGMGKIITRSAVHFLGSKGHPILIKAEKKGQGLALLAADKNSLFTHVVFKGLSPVSKGKWALRSGGDGV